MIFTSFFTHQVVFRVLRMVALLYNHVMRLVLQSDHFGYTVTYLAPRKHLDHICTSNYIIYYASHLISIMNILSRFMRPAPGVL